MGKPRNIEITSPGSLKAHSELSPFTGGLDQTVFRRFIFWVALVLFFFSFTITPFAQSGGAAGSFSRIGFGPRGMAMGNALISVSQEGIYSYYNPALAAQNPKGNQTDLSTAAMSFDRSFNTINGTFRLPPSAGLSLSIINANVDNIDGRSIDGYDTGTLSTNEYQMASALGIKLTPNLSAGVGLKFFIADYHSDLDNANTLGLDLGMLYQFSDHLQAGFTVKDLLASYSWNSASFYGDNSSARIDEFPTQFRLGASYNWDFGLLISLEGGRTTYENTSTNSLNIGSSYALHERVTIRAGWQMDDLSNFDTSNQGSAGFSIHLPFDFLSPSVDYAFIKEKNNISYMHVFGLRLNL